METRTFRDITIVYCGQDAAPWCQFLTKSFKTGQTKVRLEELDVSTLQFDQPPELQVAIQESHVVLFLVTGDLLIYMEQNASWLVNMIKSRDSMLTSIYAVCLCVGHEDLFNSAAEFGFDIDTWDEFELSENGSNVTSLVKKALEHVDYNCVKLIRKRRMTEKRVAANPKGVQLIPSTAPPSGEKAALIFTEERKGQLALHVKDVSSEPLPLTQVNPYCVTFIAPDTAGEVIQLILTEDGVVKYRLAWTCVNQMCNFTSLELLCQAHSVSKTSELDLILAKKFEESQSSDLNVLTQYLRDSVPQDNMGKALHPSMLHWAAANGLQELGAAILSTPAGTSLCQMQNSEGHDPATIARLKGHVDLSEYITQTLETDAIAEACKIYLERNSLKNETKNDPPHEEYEVMGPVPSPSAKSNAVPKSASLPPQNWTSNIPKPPIPKRKGLSTSAPDPSTEQSTYDTVEEKSKEAERVYVDPVFEEPTYEGESTYLEPDWVLPPAAQGSKSQGELINILNDVKSGSFTIPEAERLFNAWKERNRSRKTQRFKEKMSTLTQLRTQYCPSLTGGQELGKGRPTLDGALTSKNVSNFSKYVTQRRPSADKRDSKASQVSTSSTDSGIAPEDIEVKRSSVLEEYLKVIDGAEDLPPEAAPPVPPRPAKKPLVYTKAAATLPATPQEGVAALAIQVALPAAEGASNKTLPRIFGKLRKQSK